MMVDSPASAPRQLLVSPSTVLVGQGVLARAGVVVRAFGGRALVVTGHQSWTAAGPALDPVLSAVGVERELFFYRPDCTQLGAREAAAIVAATGVNVVIGVGGGKALDLAKLVGDAAHVPVVNIPTSAATCAAWTALGNFYTDEGAFDVGRPLPCGPAAVVVDTALIARAPARLLAAGLADTMAKWIETSASVSYMEADMSTRAAWRMARMLFDEIRDWGPEAYQDALAGRLTSAVERAIETNICLAGTVGGLGGERCRSVAAHAVCNALTTMPGNAASWHGEKVAFGMVTQLVLEGRASEAEELARFFVSLGIPVTLEGLGYRLDARALEAVAVHVCRPESTAHHLPIPVYPARVGAAITAADAIGRSLD